MNSKHAIAASAKEAACQSHQSILANCCGGSFDVAAVTSFRRYNKQYNNVMNEIFKFYFRNLSALFILNCHSL